MKQIILKRFVIAGLALITVPSAVLAQTTKQKDKEKEKTEKEEKEKKDIQSIVITRTGDNEEKMTIVVDGDKITVNGKDVKDLKDVNVNVNTIKGGHGFYRVPGGQNAWAFNSNDGDRFSLFNEDANRAMLGVNTDDNEKGAEIQSITEASAAEKAGLKKGDIITKVGDKKVEDADDLTEAIRSHKPGEKVAITYLRDGKEQNVNAELGKWKGMRAIEPLKKEKIMDQWKGMEDFNAPRTVQGYGTMGSLYSGRPKLGLSIQDSDDGNGVKVLEVDEESNAAKAGIKKDDIILSIDDKQVNGTEDVVRTVRDNKDKYTFTFKIQRAGKSQNIEVKFPKKLKTTDL